MTPRWAAATIAASALVACREADRSWSESRGSAESTLALSVADDESTAVSESFEAFAQLPSFQLHELGPALGGRLDAIVVMPDGTVLVASPGGGVWRHEPDTLDWVQPANRGLVDHTVVHLELDVLDPSIVYAVAWNAVFRSSNLGEDWTLLVSQPSRLRVLPEQGSVVDPKPFAQLRLSATERVLLWGPPCHGLSWSFDTVGWHNAWIRGPTPEDERYLTPDDQCVANIAPDPETGFVYFSTLGEHDRGGGPRAPGVFRSVAAWSPGLAVSRFELVAVTDDDPAHLPSQPRAVSSLAAASVPGSGDPRIVTLVRGREGSLRTWVGREGGAGFYWTLESESVPVPGVPLFQYSPRPLLYAGSGEEMFHGNVLPFQQLSFAGGWAEFGNFGEDHIDYRGLFLSPQRNAVWATADGPPGNVLSWPWNPGSPIVDEDRSDLGVENLRVWQAYTAPIVPVSGSAVRRVIAGSQDNFGLCFGSARPGLDRPTSAGTPGNGGDIYAIVRAPSNARRMYALANSGVLARSDNADSALGCEAVRWSYFGDTPDEEQLPCARANWHVDQLAVHPTNDDIVYVACEGTPHGVAYSGDGGLHWEVRPVPHGSPVSAVHVDRSGFLFAAAKYSGGRGTSNGPTVYVSSNDGMSWSEFGPRLRYGDHIHALEAEVGSASFVATSRGLYRRPPRCPALGDAGPTMGPADAGPPAAPFACWARTLRADTFYLVSDVEIDPTTPCRVYAAFGNWADRRRGGGGLWVSVDRGLHWDHLTATLEATHELFRTPIQDIDVDPVDGSLVSIATFGRGVWSLDWTGAPSCR